MSLLGHGQSNGSHKKSNINFDVDNFYLDLFFYYLHRLYLTLSHFLCLKRREYQMATLIEAHEDNA